MANGKVYHSPPMKYCAEPSCPCDLPAPPETEAPPEPPSQHEAVEEYEVICIDCGDEWHRTADDVDDPCNTCGGPTGPGF